MRLVFLGTGSGGSIQRYHTCIYVEFGDSRILLDASSGNSALVNGHKSGLDLNSINHLLLSHSHHDHSRGLEYLESHRNVSGVENSLNVYGSDVALRDVQKFFKGMDKEFLIDETGVTRKNKLVTMKWNSVMEVDVFNVDDMSIKCHPAKHIKGAVGWRIECGDESVVFSGDTEFISKKNWPLRICFLTVFATSKAEFAVTEEIMMSESSTSLAILGLIIVLEAAALSSIKSLRLGFA